MNLEIYLIRHGQTEFNLAGQIQGWCDSPLTPQGIQEAQNLGKHFKNTPFQAAFASTLPRAVHTARLILEAAQQDLPLHCFDELREYHFGKFEQTSIYDLHSHVAMLRGFTDRQEWIHTFRHSERNLFIESIHEMDANAETEAMLVSRLMQGLHLAVQSTPPQSERILIVLHGMALAVLLKALNPQLASYQTAPNASISRLNFDGQTFQVLSMGETLN